MWRPGWPGSLRNLPASASKVLESKVCTIMPGSAKAVHFLKAVFLVVSEIQKYDTALECKEYNIEYSRLLFLRHL